MSAALLGINYVTTPSYIQSKPFRLVVKCQLYVTALCALTAWWFAGVHGAVSAVFGGLVNIIAGLIYALVVSRSKLPTATSVLRTLARGEASKVLTIIVLMWIALNFYKEIETISFFSTFIITVMTFPVALLARDDS